MDITTSYDSEGGDEGMTEGLDVNLDEYGDFTVTYDEELMGIIVMYSEGLMEFRAYITVNDAEELVRNLKRAIKEARE